MTDQEPFGWELQLDLHGCSPELIKDGEVIRRYVGELVDLIEMKAYGPLQLEHFGHKSAKTSGFTVAQLIETSLISGHFSEERNSAHINVFSCRPFDPYVVWTYSTRFFKADSWESHWQERW
jgi:S-adenosylmethionine/arginine decarboxylase-like enzyme